VFVIDGGRDIDFLSQVFDKLLVNFTWWVNLEDATGSSLFEDGFLGLDNIGPLDRSHLPVGGYSSRPTRPAGRRPTRWRWEPSPFFLHRSGRRPVTTRSPLGPAPSSCSGRQQCTDGAGRPRAAGRVDVRRAPRRRA